MSAIHIHFDGCTPLTLKDISVVTSRLNQALSATAGLLVNDQTNFAPVSFEVYDLRHASLHIDVNLSIAAGLTLNRSAYLMLFCVFALAADNRLEERPAVDVAASVTKKVRNVFRSLQNDLGHKVAWSLHLDVTLDTGERKTVNVDANNPALPKPRRKPAGAQPLKGVKK